MSHEPEKHEVWWVFLNGEVSGPFSFAKIFSLGIEGKLTNRTLYWSDALQEWREVGLLLNDLYPWRDRINSMREAGITHCKVLGVGDGSECPACATLIDRIMLLDDFPGLPPPDCECTPWSRCCVASTRVSGSFSLIDGIEEMGA